MKLSISLPNNILITLESDDASPVHEVLAMVLGSAQPSSHSSVGIQQGERPALQPEPEKSNGVTLYEDVQENYTALESTNGFNGTPHGDEHSPPRGSAAGNGANGSYLKTAFEITDGYLDLDGHPQRAKDDFVAFCQSINPTGDMRRAVVAAEAARRFFELEGVTADELGELFDLIGWRRANSFTQTIRNAARSKFGWLERIPGRAGRYAATDVGRATTLSG